jgi:hypothetical protein
MTIGESILGQKQPGRGWLAVIIVGRGLFANWFGHSKRGEGSERCGELIPP